MKVAIVTGIREDGDAVKDAVWQALHEFGPDLVIHGDCRNVRTKQCCGADRYAHEWCQETGTPELPMPAQWKGSGDYASGKERNSHMVTIGVSMRACGHAVRGFAFPSPRSRGTYDCGGKLEKARLPTVWRRVLFPSAALGER